MELCSSIQKSLSPVRKFQICNVSGFLWSLCILALVYILSDQEWLAHLDAEKPNPSRSRLPVYGFQCFSFGWLVQKQQALHKILRHFYSPFTKLVAIEMVIHYFWHIRLRNHPYRKIAYYYLKLQSLKKTCKIITENQSISLKKHAWLRSLLFNNKRHAWDLFYVRYENVSISQEPKEFHSIYLWQGLVCPRLAFDLSLYLRVS